MTLVSNNHPTPNNTDLEFLSRKLPILERKLLPDHGKKKNALSSSNTTILEPDGELRREFKNVKIHDKIDVQEEMREAERNFEKNLKMLNKNKILLPNFEFELKNEISAKNTIETESNLPVSTDSGYLDSDLEMTNKRSNNYFQNQPVTIEEYSDLRIESDDDETQAANALILLRNSFIKTNSSKNSCKQSNKNLVNSNLNQAQEPIIINQESDENGRLAMFQNSLKQVKKNCPDLLETTPKIKSELSPVGDIKSVWEEVRKSEEKLKISENVRLPKKHRDLPAETNSNTRKYNKTGQSLDKIIAKNQEIESISSNRSSIKNKDPVHDKVYGYIPGKPLERIVHDQKTGIFTHSISNALRPLKTYRQEIKLEIEVPKNLNNLETVLPGSIQNLFQVQDKQKPSSIRPNELFNLPKLENLQDSIHSQTSSPTKLSPNSHTNSYECNVCRKIFIAKDRLSRHMKTHIPHDQMPFRCNYPGCGQAFARSDNLKTHMKRHSGVKDFKCEYCNYESSRSDTIKRHMRNKHPSEYLVKYGNETTIRKDRIGLNNEIIPAGSKIIESIPHPFTLLKKSIKQEVQSPTLSLDKNFESQTSLNSSPKFNHHDSKIKLMSPNDHDILGQKRKWDEITNNVDPKNPSFRLTHLLQNLDHNRHNLARHHMSGKQPRI